MSSNVSQSGSGPFQIESLDVVPSTLQQVVNIQTPFVDSSYNTTQTATIGCTPNNLIFSQNPRNSDVDSSERSMDVDAVSTMMSYLPLKLASELIPRFDGKPAHLTKFLQQCKVANKRIKPSDKKNLLSIIRSKIEGHADQLLSNRREPETLDELIALLKSAFARFFDVDRVHDELRHIIQKENEEIEYFGARVLEILTRGLEAARERYNSIEVVGILMLLKNAAIKSFHRGLRDQLLSTLLSKENPDSLENAIDIAVKVEQDKTERARQLQTTFTSKTNINKIYTIKSPKPNEYRQYDNSGISHFHRNHEHSRNTQHNQNNYSGGKFRDHKFSNKYNSYRRIFPKRNTDHHRADRRDFSSNRRHSPFARRGISFNHRDFRDNGSNNKQATQYSSHLNSKDAPQGKPQRSSEIMIVRAPIESATMSKAETSETSQQFP